MESTARDLGQMKKDSEWAPETYFLLFALWWGFLPFLSSGMPGPGDIPYPAFALVLVLTLQFFLKSRAVGLIVSGLLGLFSAYLILALLSDFFDSRSLRFLFIGGLLIATNITMAVIMFRKYASGFQRNTSR